jgi:hypothetical protein
VSAKAWRFVEGRWLHRPWWKVAINAVLRLLQPWPNKLVVCTWIEPIAEPDHPDRCPHAIGFGFRRVMHRPR